MRQSAFSAGGRLDGDVPSARATLWLVDDDVQIRQLCAELLAARGMVCTRQFGSAEEVIAALERAAGPELLLLDVNLPGLNGATAVKTIKSLSPGTTVIMFSTFYDPARAAEALAGGASGYLRKTDPAEDVLRVLRAAVRQQPPVPFSQDGASARV